jgi:arylsulfatase A-like enzyme
LLWEFNLGSGFYNTTDRGEFGDALEEMDDSIGKLMDFIEEAGIMENTLIFFSTDNG